MTVAYEQFLGEKSMIPVQSGFTIDSDHAFLYPFQRDIVRWAVKRGKAAIFADCGLGKTPMQLSWAEHVCRHTQQPVLILAPLAVAEQTQREGEKFGIHVTICRTDADVRPGVNITNYEMLEHFSPECIAGVVLDESSILKSYDGATRKLITETFADTPYKLCCTATPAPNDHMELGTHAEFLNVMSRTEMLATYFVHDGGDTSKWRLKGHAEDAFYKWLASWACALRKPSDLGYSDDGFTLPPLIYHEHVLPGIATEGALFPTEAQTLTERRDARRASLTPRIEMAASLADSDEAFICWCDLNAESEGLAREIPDAVEVTGSQPSAQKASSMLDFSAGNIRVLVTKPSIAGYGMNWQHCHNMAFVGLSDSWEMLYQATRRCWRFGQTNPVHVHIITSENEGAVVANIKRKDAEAEALYNGMVEHTKQYVRENIHHHERVRDEYHEHLSGGKRWELYRGDCVEVTQSLPENSIGYSIFSPPFSSLYTYSNSERDMGNCRSDDEFFRHFWFLAAEMYRVTMPGRLMSFHCMNLPTSKERDGYIGIRDFRGDLIRLFQEAGFIFHSEVCIWKDPVTAMQRTKALGLLHKQIKKDSCMSRQGIPDYLVTMRKPGVNPHPVAGDLVEKYAACGMDAGDIAREINAKTGGNLSIDLWQKYASPVWMDINPSYTLQKESAREEKDERHICPLQLDVIERGVILWSNVGDRVFSPFAGIGSELYMAVRMGRYGVGIELKESYWRQACANLRAAEDSVFMPSLFDEVGMMP